LRWNELKRFDAFGAGDGAIANSVCGQGHQHTGPDEDAHNEQPRPK
jgi:hypothetical protein